MNERDLAETLLRHIGSMQATPEPRELNQMLRGEPMVMVYLLDHGPAQPGELSRALCSSSAHIAKLLRSLEQKGYLSRSTDPDDRRRVNVCLTDEGRQFLQSQWDNMLDHLCAVLRALGEEDARHLVRIIGKIADYHRATHTGAPLPPPPPGL